MPGPCGEGCLGPVPEGDGEPCRGRPWPPEPPGPPPWPGCGVGLPKNRGVTSSIATSHWSYVVRPFHVRNDDSLLVLTTARIGPVAVVLPTPPGLSPGCLVGVVPLGEPNRDEFPEPDGPEGVVMPGSGVVMPGVI